MGEKIWMIHFKDAYGEYPCPGLKGMLNFTNNGKDRGPHFNTLTHYPLSYGFLQNFIKLKGVLHFIEILKYFFCIVQNLKFICMYYIQ